MRMRQITCPCWPSLNENALESVILLFSFCQYHMQCDNCKHIFNMLTYGGPVTSWMACYNMLISWKGTDWCAKSLYDQVTCMTRWPLLPVWLGNLYDQVTSLTRWPLSLGDLYDLHDQATSITWWLLWPVCPSDIYDWATSMTWRPLWLGDLHNQATCMTSMTGWPIWLGNLYDQATFMTVWGNTLAKVGSFSVTLTSHLLLHSTDT